MNNTEDNLQQKIDWWWVRHAPTGLSGCIVGATDVPAVLPSSEDLARIAGALPQDADWITSPLTRCRQTARAILDVATASDTRPVIVPEFSEQDFGAWEGLSYDLPEVRNAAEFWQDPGNTAPPDGESFAAVKARVEAGINELFMASGQSGNRNIVVVAHAGVIRAAVACALELSPNQALRLQVDPLSCTRITGFQNSQGSTISPKIAWSLGCLNQSMTLVASDHAD